MASFTSLVMLFCVLIYVEATVKMLNDKTCDVREDAISYIPIEYNCKFSGAGLYIFEEGNPGTVRKLTMDRLTELSFLKIHQGTGLKMIQLVEGSCEQIKAPMNVKIWVAGKPCVEATSTHQSSQSTPLPSTASSSGTDNTYVSVEEMTTDDHEEITPDQTTEISKPSSHSSEKTTMTAISSQQYGSTPQHNVTSEPTGRDNENDVNTTPWIISTITVIAGNIEVILATVMTILYGIYRLIIFIHQLYNHPLNQALPPPHGHLIPQLQAAHIPPPQQPVLQHFPQVQVAQQPQPVNQPLQIPQVQPAQQPQPVNQPPQIPQVQPAQQPQPVNQPPQILPHQQPNEQPNQQLRRSSRRQTPTQRLIVNC